MALKPHPHRWIANNTWTLRNVACGRLNCRFFSAVARGIFLYWISMTYEECCHYDVMHAELTVVTGRLIHCSRVLLFVWNSLFVVCCSCSVRLHVQRRRMSRRHWTMWMSSGRSKRRRHVQKLYVYLLVRTRIATRELVTLLKCRTWSEHLESSHISRTLAPIVRLSFEHYTNRFSYWSKIQIYLRYDVSPAYKCFSFQNFFQMCDVLVFVLCGAWCMSQFGFGF
jgi:hypothetical protein